MNAPKHLHLLRVFSILGFWVVAMSVTPALATAEHESDHSAVDQHGAGLEHDGPVHAPELNGTDLLAGFVNFAVLLVVLVILLRKPLQSFLKARRADIETQLSEANQLREEAERELQACQARLAKLDDEMKRVREDIIEAGQAERDRIVAEAEQKAERMRKEVEFLVEQQVKQMHLNLVHDISDASLDAATDLLQRQTHEADRDRLAQDFLKTLLSQSQGASHAGSSGTPGSSRTRPGLQSTGLQSTGPQSPGPKSDDSSQSLSLGGN